MNTSFKLFLMIFGLFAVSCGNEPKSSSNTASSNQNSSKTYKPSIQTAVGILLPEKSAEKGENVCMDVTVKDFNQIVSMQHSVNWNPNILKFNRIGAFNLQGLSDAGFGTKQAAEGNFGVSWYDASLKGVTLHDGSKIYEVCFEVIGNSGESSRVKISNTPVTIEVSTSNDRLLEIPTGKGKILVK